MSLGSFLSIAAQILPTAIQLFRKPPATPTIPQQQQAVQQQQQFVTQQAQLAQALADPSSPILARLAEQEEQTGFRELGRGVEDLIRRNRRLARLGRVPLFSGERADEQIFRAISLGRERVRDTARQSALQRVTGAANILGGVAGQQAQVAGGLQRIGQQQQAAASQRQQQIIQAARTFGDIISSREQRQQDARAKREEEERMRAIREQQQGSEFRTAPRTGGF